MSRTRDNHSPSAPRRISDEEYISQSKLKEEIEETIQYISTLLYDTNVEPVTLEQEVAPYLAHDVVFKDPWQEGGGIQKYILGMKGFHCMFYFTFQSDQVSVQLDEDGKGGRAMIDGTMYLKQLRWLFTYPLRTILLYKFRFVPPEKNNPKRIIQIYYHEEMWSFGDMIQNIPLVGKIYDLVFRPSFGLCFLGASAMSRLIQGAIRGPKWGR